MNRTFDFYEYAGVIIPGAVLLLGLVWLFPDHRLLFSKEGVTFGELGLFVIVAYAAGQLVQAIGNFIESVWWKLWGGWPSGKVLVKHYVSPEQHKRIVEALQTKLKFTASDSINLPVSVVREVYALVAAAGKAARIDMFSGNYGLARGLAASFFVLLPAAVGASQSRYVIGGLIILFLLALQRMHRFGKHYATELFVQFLTFAEVTEHDDER
jgi:hypothetical protein